MYFFGVRLEGKTVSTGDRVVRRLAAILALDMVGYSRHMEADETGTLARQKAHRQERIDTVLREQGGRIVKTTGDGLLVEFGSVIDALDNAVQIQRAIAKAEAERPRSIEFNNAGVNLGDIVIDGDDIFGDGVNIAARLGRSRSRAEFPLVPASSNRLSESLLWSLRPRRSADEEYSTTHPHLSGSTRNRP
jgi:class 3 adenylate cyclase